MLVVCRTDPNPKAGAKAFSILIVERDMPGFERGRNLDKLGQKAQDTSELFFNDVKVPRKICWVRRVWALSLMRELPQERLSIAVSAVAGCESVMEQTVKYVKERKAFGKTIADFQNTQFVLALSSRQKSRQCVSSLTGAELLLKKELTTVDAPAAARDRARPRHGPVCQLHGGYGYMWEYLMTRRMPMPEFAIRWYSEVMKLIIGRDLLSD